MRFCTLLGDLSGIGGNPTFCAALFFGDFGSVAQALLASGDVNISNQVCGSKLQWSGWPRLGSVRFYSLGIERFQRFRFSVPAVPLRREFLCVSVQFHRGDGSGSGFGSWKTVPAVPVPRSVPAKTVPTVPVSGSGSVPGPPWMVLVTDAGCPDEPPL